MALAFPLLTVAAEPDTAGAPTGPDASPGPNTGSKPHNLPSVVVTGRPSATRQSALRDDIVKTETINAAEIEKSGPTNLTELMSHRPGIDVQAECSVCNVRNITLNNLPGRFTTLLLDGVPIFSSVSNADGLNIIGLNGLQRGTSRAAPAAA